MIPPYQFMSIISYNYPIPIHANNAPTPFHAHLSHSIPHDTVTASDCMLRTRFVSKWTLLASFDEYPAAVEPHSLSKILAANAGRPWITIGTHLVHLELCIEVNREFDELT